MFEPTNQHQQLSVLSSNNTLLSGRSLTIFEDENEWHNLFRTQISARIDEELFRPLFFDGFGAPNASIRVLVSMFILKAAHGLSDSQLFSHCRFDILYRCAIGLHNLEDPLPTESTYYLLRKRMTEWKNAGHEDLMEQVFTQLTRSQIMEFNVDGKKIRMDSKLIGSDIAWCNRYELIHDTLRLAYRKVKGRVIKLFSEPELSILDEISGESGNKVSYRSNRSEIETSLTQLGSIIYKIISYIKEDTTQSIKTLRQVFEQQYEVVGDTVIPLPKEQIKATSIQSPNDTDCDYRHKGDKQIKGFSLNATETCDQDNKLNLITDVTVRTASTADCDFLQSAVEATQEIVSQPIETLNSDGAYHSIANENYCKEMGIDLIMGGIQGKQPRYTYSFNENGELEATDIQTNKVFLCRVVKPRKNSVSQRWVFTDDIGKLKYVTLKDIETSALRKRIKARTKEELNLRNNVEATIFQIGYHYRGNKSRYRGLYKHQMWANARCIWINFVRIMKYMISLTTSTPFLPKKEVNSISIFDFLYQAFLKIAVLISLLPFRRNFRPTPVRI